MSALGVKQTTRKGSNESLFLLKAGCPLPNCTYLLRYGHVRLHVHDWCQGEADQGNQCSPGSRLPELRCEQQHRAVDAGMEDRVGSSDEASDAGASGQRATQLRVDAKSFQPAAPVSPCWHDRFTLRLG